ncbi:hypothetical protein ACFQ48_09445 [Hymenobacter caeli]|uniref:Roadblock/LAMTOR2 domain-containing protein n=1 Tax=Hymenobacter caeli TaxID=2735894 RepID=A0ABX2FMB2_9BACT|nr:hypothetical protein [Hymenobacter caeli]NRT18293.1 hypothetical protein [Hymenobacter caeli]
MKARTYRKLVEKKNQELALASAAAVPAGPHPAAAGAVQNILADLPQLMAVAIVDVTSGMSLASHSNSPAINPDTAAAYNTEVVKQKQKAMAALKLQGETIEDILITLTNQLHLIKLSTSGTKFIYLVVNMRDTNLAIAREVLRANASGLD